MTPSRRMRNNYRVNTNIYYLIISVKMIILNLILDQSYTVYNMPTLCMVASPGGWCRYHKEKFAQCSCQCMSVRNYHRDTSPNTRYLNDDRYSSSCRRLWVAIYEKAEVSAGQHMRVLRSSAISMPAFQWYIAHLSMCLIRTPSTSS